MGSNPAQGNSSCFSFDIINQLIYRMGFISSFYGIYIYIYIYIYLFIYLFFLCIFIIRARGVSKLESGMGNDSLNYSNLKFL